MDARWSGAPRVARGAGPCLRGRRSAPELATFPVRLAVAAILTLAGILPPALRDADAAVPPAATSLATVVHGTWRLESPLGEVAGPFLVVQERQGLSYRCEIAVAEQGRWPTRDELDQRRGRGWTLTRTPESSFVQPWSEPWRELGAEAAGACGELIARWRVGDLEDFAIPWSRPRRWRPRQELRPRPVVLDDWAGLPAAWRPPARGTEQAGQLRRRLTTRGLGRGGDGLVLDLRWEGEELVATSARWPGRLVLRESGSEQLALPAEAYLPLWPLAEFRP
jgi:hypothetical protein